MNVECAEVGYCLVLVLLCRATASSRGDDDEEYLYGRRYAILSAGLLTLAISAFSSS